MGIDICHKNQRKSVRRRPRSHNIYLLLLVKLYKHLYARTKAKFNRIILKRLFMSRKHRPVLSISRIQKHMRRRNVDENRRIVCVGTVCNDTRLLNVKKLNICALHVTEMARARILKAGGSVITFDQLAVSSPTGKNTLFLQGPRNAHEAYKHRGAAGVKRSHAKPYVLKNSNRERGRGKNRSTRK